MLVRELIEQLAEMPPDLPVNARLWWDDPVPVRAVVKGGRESGPGVFLVLDGKELQLSYDDYVASHVEDPQ